MTLSYMFFGRRIQLYLIAANLMKLVLCFHLIHSTIYPLKYVIVINSANYFQVQRKMSSRKQTMIDVS